MVTSDVLSGRPTFAPVLIAVVDIGSPQAGRLGWATLPDGRTGKAIGELVATVSDGLERGPVALGFEAPLWVPARSDEMAVTGARVGEKSRAWSAGAGSGALATGLAVIPHILARLRKAAPKAVASMDWKSPPAGPQELLLWEAFVSSADKGDSHEEDALIAARGFERACRDLQEFQKLESEACLNLLGACLLRTGWSNDIATLSSDLLVLRL